MATARAAPLRLRGGGSKDFYGNEPRGEVLDTRGYAGIVDYEPSELVLTARGGTALAEVEAILGEKGQCLPFEPPHFGAATLGGCIAAGLSGPRRAAAGALRDFVLGVIAEASVKVLPRPPAERTLRFDMELAAALDAMNVWAGEPLPISATAWHDGVLNVRLAGSAAAVQAATPRLGGTEAGDSIAFWRAIREQTHAFFAGDEPLWRVAVPSAAAPLGLPGAQLLEWHGGLRWLRSRASAEEMRVAAKRAGGHATLFRARDKSAGAFTPLDPLLLRLHRALKSAFDPAGILNPGRMYAEF